MIKGYYRLGSAQLALGKYKEAVKSFKQVVKIYPQNKEAKEKLTTCEKVVRRLAFEDAIAVNDVPVSETIDLSSFAVDSSYTGPSIGDDNKITLEFVKQMMDHLRKEQKLHIK